MRIPILFLSLLMGKSLYTMESQSISIVGETSVANLQITFIEGVKVNDIETVTNLLTQGINPFLRDSEGLSALDHAARLGAAGAEMRKLLLEHCSRLHVIVPERVNSANNGCFSTPYITHNRALLDAFSTENTKKFKSLLKSPLADIHCKSSYEGDPLWLELRRRYNEERRNLPQQEDERPHTLFKKLATILPSLCAKQQTHLRKLYTILIAHEAQLRTNKKLTPLDDLIRALIEENNEEVRILAVSVHDINQLDPNCHSALGIALLYNPSCVSLLCANSKLNPNIPSKAKIGLSNFNRLIYSLEQALDLFAMSTEISNEDAVADFFSGYEP